MQSEIWLRPESLRVLIHAIALDNPTTSISSRSSTSMFHSSMAHTRIHVHLPQVKGTQMTNSPPDSLLLLDTPAAASSGPLDDDSPPGALFLHAGLANGVLLRSEVRWSRTLNIAYTAGKP